MVIATPSAARKPLIANSGNFSLPNIVFDDPYFTKEKRVFSRLEALAWIAKHVRWTDNCVLKKGQGSWSIRFLAEAWGWGKDKVNRFLKRLESMSAVQVVRESASATAQTVITYLFSGTYKSVETVGETAPRQHRDSSATKTNPGNPGKEDSPVSPQGDDPEWEDPFEASGQADGAGPSEVPAEQPADPHPNSAAPSPRKPKAGRAPIDESWQPSAATRAWGRSTKVGATDAQIDVQVEEFLNYYLFGDGRKKNWSDWDRAFQTWVRRAKNFGSFDAPRPKFKTREEAFSI